LMNLKSLMKSCLMNCLMNLSQNQYSYELDLCYQLILGCIGRTNWFQSYLGRFWLRHYKVGLIAMSN
jgi:hypothetical protein